jgi:hypothetical protein
MQTRLLVGVTTMSDATVLRHFGATTTENVLRFWARSPNASAWEVIDASGPSDEQVSPSYPVTFAFANPAGPDLWREAQVQMATYSSEALGVGERAISPNSASRMDGWLRALEKRWASDAHISLEATGMSTGGSVLVLFNPSNQRQFTLRINPDGSFFMASRVYGNLKSELLSDQETPEGALAWLLG